MDAKQLLRPTWMAACMLGLLAAGPATADDASSNPLPRYKFQVGQELLFRGEYQFRYDGGAHGSRDNWNVWVVRENPDGSWRLLVRHGSSFGSARDERPKDVAEKGAIGQLLDLLKPAPEGTEPENPPAEPAESPPLKLTFQEREDVSFAWCDFHPDGRFVENDSFGYQMRLSRLLPPLPTAEEEATNGWTVRSERMDDQTHYLLKVSTADTCQIEFVIESAMNEIYGSENKGVITIDRLRGLPGSSVSSITQTYGFKGRGSSTLSLVEAKSHPADWIARFSDEADRYFAAKAHFDQQAENEDLSGDEFKAALEKGLEQLREVGKTIENPELKLLVEEQIANTSSSMEYRLQAAEERRAVLGKPSEEWSTTDLAGAPHALNDYRGKVVILDFWYRGCGWCIRAMPQVKQVADHFEGQPVAVLGMNTDREASDAQFVIDRMKLNYPNLKATGIPEKYGVSGFPTLVILDQEGVIRDVHVGYSPTLKKAVVESVEKLLQ